MSLLHAADVHAGHKVLLQEGIYHQNRNSRHHGDGGSDGEGRHGALHRVGRRGGAGVGGGRALHHLHQFKLQGIQRFIARRKHIGVEPAVPLVDGDIQGHRGQNRLGHRCYYSGKNGKFLRAVQPGALINGIGDALHVGPDQDHINK